MHRRKFLQGLSVLVLGAVVPVPLLPQKKSYGLFGIDPNTYRLWQLGKYNQPVLLGKEEGVSFCPNYNSHVFKEIYESRLSECIPEGMSFTKKKGKISLPPQS